MACLARVKKQPTIDGCYARSRNGDSVREARGSVLGRVRNRHMVRTGLQRNFRVSNPDFTKRALKMFLRFTVTIQVSKFWSPDKRARDAAASLRNLYRMNLGKFRTLSPKRASALWGALILPQSPVF
jgi:hypothetical protein